MPELLSLRGLSVRYPVRTGFLAGLAGRSAGVVSAVDGVDLSLGQGEILALVGESGCGKTTTGRAALRLVDPRRTSGLVSFEGQDVYAMGGRQLKAYRRAAQIVFQDPYQSLDPKYRAVDAVAEPLLVHGLAARNELRDRAAQALESAGLRPAATYLDRYPHELSGGQRQRLAIASALVLEPRMIVADEPVSMLDLSVRAGILRLLARLRDERGLSFIFITHDLALAWLIADRISIMYLGRVVESGPAQAVLERPLHPYARALVDVMPRFEGRGGAPRRVLAGEPPNPAAIPSGCRFRPRCPLATEACKGEEPTLRDYGNGHLAACRYAEPR